MPHGYPAKYPRHMAERKDMRRLRVDDDLWVAYTEIVGNAGRSADIKAYIEWRVDNPTMPLPGERKGPVRRTRNLGEKADAAA